MCQSNDPFNLRRFIEAQDRVYKTVLAELRQGEKRTHWMWYIFPQIDGLGHSPMSQRYAIKNLNEARDYLNHPILGPRLIECTQIVLDKRLPVETLFGNPDDLKFHSCMTLFAHVSAQDSVFARALSCFFLGKQDHNTLQKLDTL